MGSAAAQAMGRWFRRGVDHIRDKIEQMDTYLKVRSEKVIELETIGRETIEIHVDYFTEVFNLACRKYLQFTAAGEKCS